MKNRPESFPKIEITDKQLYELYMNQLKHCSKVCHSASEYFSDSVADDISSVLFFTEKLHWIYIDGSPDDLAAILNGEDDHKIFDQVLTDGICSEILELPAWVNSEESED